jgi:hypothetical protein
VDSPFNKKERPCNQWKAIGLMIIIVYIKVLIEGEVTGLRPRTSPFWVFVVTMCIFEIFFSGEFSSVLYMMVGHHIWRGPTRFGRSGKSFSIYIFLLNSLSGYHWEIFNYHVASNHWAT